MRKIYIAGHNGMVGAALVRQLVNEPNVTLITASKSELDLTVQQDVDEFIADHKPDEIYLAAAKVGGILANASYPADFLAENLLIQGNIIRATFNASVPKLMFLGSSCIYPKLAHQPIAETELLTGPLEPTNQAYAIAKIAGLKMCEAYRRQYNADFRAVMPTNLYGPYDRFDLQNSHVIPALMRRIHEAKSAGAATVSIWGSGKPLREFLHVDDMARGSIFAMNVARPQYDAVAPIDSAFLNVGTGVDCSIKELAETLIEVIGFKGNLDFDASKPDGTPRKLLNTQRMTQLGWTASIDLAEGLRTTYAWYVDNIEQANSR